MSGPARRSGRRLLTEEQQAVVRRMVEEGATRDEIASSIGVTPYILENRIRDQDIGVRLKVGRPKGGDTWVDPIGAEDEASRSSLALAPWVAARAAELRATWTPERWARAEGRRLPLEVDIMPPIDEEFDFTGDGIAS